MNGARNAQADRADASTGLASWYVPGYPDGFGDRLLMFDNTSTPSLTLLRFHRHLVASPGFEDALRQRVQALSEFRHETFAAARSVQYLDDNALTLVSQHADGQRLAEIFEQRPRTGLNPGIVTWILRELTPALSALQNEGNGIAHGAITPDRIVLTPDGQLRVVEHVLGAALLELRRSSASLFRDFQVFAPADEQGVAFLDASTDMSQLAAVALSMLLARPLTLQDVQLRVPALLDEFSAAASTPALQHHVSPLRHFFERALLVDGSGYRSAEDAEYDVRQLPSHDDGTTTMGGPRKQLVAPAAPVVAPTRPVARGTDTEVAPPRPALRPVPRLDEIRVAPTNEEEAEAFISETAAPQPETSAPAPTAFAPVPRRETSPGREAAPAREPAPRRAPAPPREPITSRGPAPRPSITRPAAVPAPPRPVRSAPTFPERSQQVSASLPPLVPVPRGSDRGRTWLIAAMALAIVAQTAVIGVLVTRPVPVVRTSVTLESAQAGDVVEVNGQIAGHTPMQLNVGTDVKSLKVVSTTSTRNSRRGPVKGASDPAPAPRAKTGGVRVVSALELKVFEGNEPLGSSADGTIKLAPGTHQLDLVNAAVGFRDHQTVTVTAGAPVTVNVTLPEGAVSIKSEPPAAVVFDKKDIGEAPISSIKATIGEHEIVFRHSTLGEVRRTVLVKQGETTEVAVKFE